jgi:hypothetical protein
LDSLQVTGDGGHALAWLKNGKALDFGSFESKKRGLLV